MQTIQPIQIENAEGPMLRILEVVKSEQAAFFNEEGALSNMVQTLAHSPRAIEGYVHFNRTLAHGKLGSKFREQLALAVAQANQCEYSLSQHASMARRLGLSNNEILASREARGTDVKTRVALQFAQGLVTRSSGTDAEDLRGAGYTDAEIVEIVGQVALNVFENYFNAVVKTDVDFPRVSIAKAA
jgi:AhpD family alkylhydroperoxidase